MLSIKRWNAERGWERMGTEGEASGESWGFRIRRASPGNLRQVKGLDG